MSDTPSATPAIPEPAQDIQPERPKRFVPPRPFAEMTQAERETFLRPPHISPPMPSADHPFRRG